MKSTKQVVLIGVIGVMMGLFVNTFRPSGIALTAEPEITADAGGADTLSVDAPAMAVVSFEEVDALFRKDLALFIDARDAEDYDRSHLPGAMSSPVADYRAGDVNLRLPKGTLLVIYCAGVECELAEELAVLLATDGYRKIRLYPGGFEEWEAMGMPVSSGPE